MSLGVIVVEAAERSGALISARHAMEQGREVFAVPGTILRRSSAGPNYLIQNGAKLVTHVNDMLEELNLTRDPSRHPLFDIMFSFYNYNLESIEDIKKNENNLMNKIFENNTAKFDLLVHVRELQREIQFTLEYNNNLFKVKTIRSFISYLKKIILVIIISIKGICQ